MVDMTAEHLVNEISAIRKYQVTFTIFRTGTQWRGSSKCRKQVLFFSSTLS